MNLNKTQSGVEHRDDQILFACEEAAAAEEEAIEQAMSEVDFGSVLEYMAENFTSADVKIFMRGLQKSDRQSLSMMLHLIQKSFDTLVEEKTREILESSDGK